MFAAACYYISIPAVCGCCISSDPQSCWICGQFEHFYLSINDISENTISNVHCVLNVLSTPWNSLSNGATNSSMFHQKYLLNWQKQKTRY